MRKVERIEVSCAVCGKSTFKMPLRVRKHNFCSHGCHNSVQGQHICRGFKYEVPDPCPGRYKIYRLVDPETNQTRYVGATRDCRARFLAHLNDCKRSAHALHVWLVPLKAKGLVPRLEIFEVCDDSNWEDRESHWIKQQRESGSDLLNRADGGRGIKGVTFPDESKAKMTLAAIRRCAGSKEESL